SDIEKLEADKRANGELKEQSKDALYECKSLLGKIEGGLSISYKQYVRVATHALNSPQQKTGVLADARDLLDLLPATDQFQTDLALIVRSCFACAADCLVEYQKGKAESGLMDFADQESMVLARLVANASDGSAAQSNLVQSLERRIQKLMVDEFQDTNPIQLALFRALHQLSGDSTWVGDPKQSIYRFRGADPDLMNQALASATKEDPLSECRRSTPSLIRFFNALFCKVFSDEDPRDIEVTAYRKDDVNEALGIWYLEGSKQSRQMQALARAIRDLLEQRPELRPCDVAILCRTNNRAGIIASALEALGMRASAPQGALCDTREVQLCLAGLRLFVDSKDSLARAEIMRLHPDHPHHSHWIESIQQASASTDPFTESFQELRGRAGDTSLPGVLEAIIDVLDLDRLVDGWALPHLRRQNMDRLLGLAVEYCELCRMQGKPWHIGGFLQFLDEKQPEQARGVGEDTIEVITYHGAKGLEWKVVILAELHESQSDRLPDALQVVGAEKFDSLDPLAGRWLRFWPRPFGDGKSYDFFNDLLDASEEMQSQSAAAAEEQKRLLYVGMTRARDTLIFSIGTKVTQKDGRKFEASWLDNLRAEP
ncbi:MAG: UvrD-helicase domain-containing protein, partial [Leptospiraceae bacterium]|nr:UvrD-helicase domain-containing protein [Leptospiraceae bacterium]